MANTLKVDSYAIYEFGKELKEFTYELGALPDDYVDVKVTHSGVCYTDIAVSNGEFGPIKLPAVGGHEVAGVIHAVGKAVTNVKVGDRVGCHNVRSSCSTCKQCSRGDDVFCVRFDALATGGGGFGQYVRMQAPYVYPLPESLPNEYAASLMCAGATMWSAFIDANIKSSDRVGILGIGGLGHLGLKFSKAFGCDTTAISTNKSKEAEAKSLGANQFLVLNDAEDMKKFNDYFDHIIVTSTAEIDWVSLTSLLRGRGSFVVAGIPGAKMTFNPMLNLFKALKVITVAGCTRKAQAEMIEFCGRHKIYPNIELLPINQINEAFDKVKKGTPRFRMVLTF